MWQPYRLEVDDVNAAILVVHQGGVLARRAIVGQGHIHHICSPAQDVVWLLIYRYRLLDIAGSVKNLVKCGVRVNDGFRSSIINTCREDGAEGAASHDGA